MNIKENTLIGKNKNSGIIKNSTGLTFSILENAGIKTIEQGKVQINLLNGSPLDNGCFNIYLRKRGNQIEAIPLFGPNSHSKYMIENDNFEIKGQWENISYSCRLLLAEKENSWLWDLKIENLNGTKQELDLIYVQDVGLTAADGCEKNELYVSQYIDYTPILHKEHGYVVCCRQNEHGPDCIPWLALGSISKANSFSTDGMQFFGPGYKEQLIAKGLSLPQLPGLSQQEFAVIALQEKPFILEGGQIVNTGCFGVFCPNHPAATGNDDINFIDKGIFELKKLSKSQSIYGQDYDVPVKSLFSESPFFIADNLTETEISQLFGVELRHCEYADNKLLSFFYGEHNHVVLREKELRTSRPHGHIMKTGSSLVPDDSSMSVTSYMFGVFQSHITQGNVNFNRFVGVNSNALNIPRYTGQRIFIIFNNEVHQLGIPSAFEMSNNHCRWIYKQNETIFEIVSQAAKEKAEIILEIKVIKGQATRWIISNQLADENKWKIEQRQSNGKEILTFVPGEGTELLRKYPEGHFDVCLENSKIKKIDSDRAFFEDGASRGLNFLTIELAPTKEFTMSIVGRLMDKAAAKGINNTFKISYNGNSSAIDEILEIMPWYWHNAQIHYLAPRGLEQFSGAAWGTRDVCQGAVEMLLSYENYPAVRKILSLVFSNQNADGNWPQWWMFDNYNNIRFHESHGDVIFWPILAVSQYIRSSGDFNFLDEELPYYQSCAVCKLIDHIHHAIEYISTNRFVSGTSLVNYDGGDWNDSMQPVNKELKNQLISSWTVILSYQTFKEFAEICHKAGFAQTALKLERMCELIKADFNKYLIKNDVVAGFGFAANDNKIDLLLHPSDSEIGIHYSLIPMTRGIISGIFNPAQAQKHYEIIEKHLKGPDGARLMDKSPEYTGGLQSFFKRAESCPFFGREIGLMYTHAHLRYAQALAKMGKACEFVKALRQAVPINLNKIVPAAGIRQSNCYYSSSDGAFESRYEANRRYDDLINGKIKLNGGWRIYSSGPGIFINNVISNLAGIRHCFGHTIIDPILPQELDGLSLLLEFRSAKIKMIYQITGNEKGVTKITINESNIEFERETNPYRIGGAVIEDAKLKAVLNLNISENIMRITL